MRSPVWNWFLTRCFCLTLLASMLASPVEVRAQFFRNGAVGGVSIDARGVLSEPSVEDAQSLRQDVEAQLAAIPQEMDTQLGLRRISLRALEATLAEAAVKEISSLPEDVRYLAGLQRVQYVLVYPDQQDIVLVGPAEGWRVNQLGQVVGKTTGRPVIQLEDLIVAFRAVYHQDEAISCSIDPTAEGTAAMRRFVKHQKQFTPETMNGMAEALGPQQITITGVPESSHFARVLVAADYRMKRIAMQLEESPLETLPSFLEMLADSRAKLTNMMPRWWLACDYEPLARSEDGLAWELRGQGVQVKTEDSLVGDDGSFKAVEGRSNPVAARWAQQMTRQYDELSRETAVFGQLRNLMDISVIAALIRKEQLVERAECPLPSLTGENTDFALQSWNAPKTIATQCSFVKRNREFLVTASGGVQIDNWHYASQSEVSPRVAEVRSENVHVAGRWWW